MTGGTGSVAAFASAADELCRQEIARIRNAMVPTIAALRLMSLPALCGTRRAEIFPDIARQTVGRGAKGSFLLSANGIPIAWADPHGASLKWIADVASMPCPRWAAV
jgi:hypothetical protein